jgi:hypothetical protein
MWLSIATPVASSLLPRPFSTSTPGTLQDHYKYSDEHPMVVSVKTQLQRAKQKIGATKTVSKVGKKGPLNCGVYAAVLCCVVEAGESSVCVL